MKFNLSFMFPLIIFHLCVPTITTSHNHILILCVPSYMKCSIDVIFLHVNLLLFDLSHPDCRLSEMFICQPINHEKEINGIFVLNFYLVKELVISEKQFSYFESPYY